MPASGVIQQGMNGERRQARRYHWLSEGLKSFVDEPHTAIEGAGQGEIINLTDHRADLSRRVQLEVLHSWGPDRVAREVMALEARGNGPAVAGSRAARTAAFGHARPPRGPPKRRSGAALARELGRSSRSRPH